MSQCIRNTEIGDEIIFYANTQEGCLFGRDLTELAAQVRAIRPLHYDRQMLWSLLVYGFSPTCHTVYEEIRRIPAGCELIIGEDGVGRIRRYHLFSNQPNGRSLDENITEWDRLFRQAVQRILDFNKANGKTNYFALSAGLDSRMAVRVAKELTDEPIVNVTYSQTGFCDDVVPHQIASYLGNEIVFRPLDGGDYLRNVDEAILRTHALVNYTGAAQVMDSFDRLPAERIGVVGTGMIGDAFTHFSPSTAYAPMLLSEGALQPYFYDRIMPLIYPELNKLYPNREINYLYTRCFNCANLGAPVVLTKLGGSMSPFCDPDFLKFCLAVPAEQRVGYKLYDEWIRRYYPDMTQWPHNGTERIGHRHKRITVAGRTMRLRELPQRIVWKILKELHLYDGYKLSAANSMNPEDTWLEQNEELRHYLDRYFEENIGLLDFDPELQQALREMYAMSATEKLQAITVVGAVKNYPLS